MSEEAARSALRRLLEPLEVRTPVSPRVCTIHIGASATSLTEDILRALREAGLVVVRRGDLAALAAMAQEFLD